MKIALGYLLTFGWVFLILGVTQLIKAKTRASDELSRKTVHVAVAFAWLPMFFCFGATWHLVVPPMVFTALNYASCKKNIFTAMERSDKSRQSYGTVYYALSMALMAAASALDGRFLLPYGTGLFCMALGDGFAPCFGAIRRGNRTLVKGRTLYGSVSVFLISLLVALVMSLAFSMPLAAWELLVIAAGATVFELLGARGLDNLTLPLGVCALTFAFTVN